MTTRSASDCEDCAALSYAWELEGGPKVGMEPTRRCAAHGGGLFSGYHPSDVAVTEGYYRDHDVKVNAHISVFSYEYRVLREDVGVVLQTEHLLLAEHHIEIMTEGALVYKIQRRPLGEWEDMP